MHTLKLISELIGVSGYEEAVRNNLRNYITNNNSQVQIETDKIGNLIIHKKGEVSNIRIMIIAHMDEVGFQVMNVDETGKAKVKTLRQYVLVLYEHKEIESEINGCYEVIKFLAHLFRHEIKCFVERTEKALLIAKTKKFNLVGTLRNVQKEYAIVFTATEQGEQIPSEELLPVVFEKQKVHTLLQVITYWVNDNEYMIDFVLWQG